MSNLKVDIREPTSVFSVLIDRQIEFDTEQLPVGDFVFEDICIERKEIKDFLSSLSDGRLLVQIQNMI